jgi:Mrp family chromosome partitioning ATPase
MGRFLDTLRQAEGQQHSPEPHQPALRPIWPDDIEGGCEVPYIEVGPRKSLEASPGVLLTVPAPTERGQAHPLAVSFRGLKPRSGRIAVEIVAFHLPDHAVSGQYRQLLASLFPSPPSATRSALLFIATADGVASATVVANLAVMAARQNKGRVLVVNADREQTILEELLGLAKAPGLNEVLAGGTDLRQVLQDTEQAGLTALATGVPAPSEGVRFQAGTLGSVLRQLRHQFDLILVQGPAWEGRAEQVALATACNGVCVVVPEAEAEAPHVDAVLQALSEKGACPIGCILAG